MQIPSGSILSKSLIDCSFERSINPAFIEIDEVRHRLNFAHAINAAHCDQCFFQEILSGRSESFLDEFAIPFRRSYIRRQQRFQFSLNLLGRGRFENYFFDRRWIDPEVEAQKAVETAFVVFRVAGGK